jgi:hypothetical protein
MALRIVTAMAVLLLLGFSILTLVPATVTADNGVDGMIEEEEYPLSVSLGNGHFKMYWEVQDDIIKMGISAEATGMVAIGWEPSRRMLDADMIIGFRGGSEFELHDTISVGETGPHPDDVDEGGTYDILEYMMTEVGGVTTIEFTRLLDTGDDMDNPIPSTGVVKFIWATSESDDFATYHARRGTAEVNIETGEFKAVEYPTLWPYHAIFMSMAMIFLLAAMFCVVYKRNLKKKYLGYHHYLGTSGVFSAIIGLGIGVYMVQQLESGHIRIAHSAVAVLDLAVAIIALYLGVMFMTRKELKGKVRKPHMYIGGLAILLMAVVVLMGLIYVFPV